MGGWLASVKLAWRDLWAMGRRAVFFALLVAAGVASLVGVQGAARSLEDTTRDGARQATQGDLVLVRGTELSKEQQAALDALKREGAQLSETWEMNGIAVNPANRTQVIVDIKMVDPKTWPFYGGFKASPNKPMSELITSGKQAVVAPALLEKLSLKVGDTFQLGKETYTITGAVEKEPQSLNQSKMPIGPRVFLSTEGAQTGGLEQRSILVKLPAGKSAEEVKRSLKAAFPGDQDVQTYEEAWKSFANVMGSFYTFLSMVALVSLLVGGLGVAMAMRTFISQKMEHIAVLKAVGAPSRRIMLVFLVQAALLGFGGSLLGVVLGLGVQQLLPYLLNDLFPIGEATLNWGAALGGLGAGTAIAVICALLPVRAVRNVKPMALFRSESVPVRPGIKAWLETAAAGLTVLAGLGWLATVYAKSVTVGFGFLGALVGAALALFVVTWIFLRLVRLLPQSGLPTFRHAIRSLYSPGSQAPAVVVAMGIGIMLTTAVYMIQNGLISQVREAGAGPDTVNLYVINVSESQRTPVRTYLEQHPGVARVPEPILMVNATIMSIDGKPASELTIPDLFKRPFPITNMTREVPRGLKVVEGEWFTAADAGKPFLTVEERYARQMGIKAGSKMVLRLRNEEVEFTVKSLLGDSGNAVRLSTNGPVSAAPGTLDRFAETYMLTAITKPGQEQAVVSDVLAEFPGTLPMGLGGLMDVVDSFLGKLANILRFMTGFAVVAAGVILSGSLSATRFRRRKEGALLKTLGASRATVAAASALENGLLGFLAGLVGGGLGYALVAGAGAALKITLTLSLWPLLTASLAGAVLAVAVGFASTLDVLNVRPLQVLRSG